MAKTDEFHKIYKVGIYRDTNPIRGLKETQPLTMVIRDADGTTYFFFDGFEFSNGWREPSGREPMHRYAQRHHSGIRMLEGAMEYVWRANGRHDWLAEAAFRQFSITPSFLERCGNTGPHRIKWATRKKGFWGGARPGAGRRPNDWYEDYH